MKQVMETLQRPEMVERQSNIELLRIFSIIGVIILHYNNPIMGGGMRFINTGSINFYVMYYLQAIFVCAVDTFILISGYFLCTSNKRNLWKPFELILQLVLFNIGMYLASVVIKGKDLSVKSLLGCFLPANYFVILYSTLFVISPFLNVIIQHTVTVRLDDYNDRVKMVEQRNCYRNMDKNMENWKNFMIILLLLFSVWPTIVDVLSEIRGKEIFGLSTIGNWGSQSGYTIVNFVLLYFVGAWVRITEMTEMARTVATDNHSGIMKQRDNEVTTNSEVAKIDTNITATAVEQTERTKQRQVIMLISFLAIALLIMFFIIIEMKAGFTLRRSSTAYFNPLVICEAVLIFKIFQGLRIKNTHKMVKWINVIAKGTFTIFLFHSCLLKYLNIQNYVNTIAYVPHLIISVLILFSASYIVYVVYNTVTEPLLRKLKRRVPVAISV